MTQYKPIVIGVGGFARSGKDTFVKVAKQVLKDNGYSCIKLAFADALKEEIDPFLRQHYDISAWTDDTDEKKIIRPYLVAHGCGKRMFGDGRYWIDQIDQAIESIHFTTDVIFISDCRFENEVDWLHEKWGGWFVHLKKYSVKSGMQHDSFTGGEIGHKEWKQYDEAPNEEEAIQDPKCEAKADYKLELENVVERELRLTGNKISVNDLTYNTYLSGEIKICLSNHPAFSKLKIM